MATEKFEIVITSKGSRTIKRDFDSVAKSAERTGTAATRTGRTIDSSMRRSGAAVRRTGQDYRLLQREMRVTGQSSGLLAAKMASLNRAFVVPGAAQASLRNAGRSLRGLIGLFSAFYAIRYIGEAADSFTRMSNALKGFGVGSSSISRVRKEIVGLSNDARVDAEQATVLFGRLRLATRDLGATEQDVLGITGTINKALRLSGSSSLEASQSIRQLSQAFNKGKLDGDEFRSVLENAPILTKLLSEELNISKRELRDWARQGKISVKVLYDALRNGQQQINEEFAKLKPTLGDAFVTFYNKAREFIGDTPAITGSMKVLVRLLELVGDNLSTVLGLLQAIAAVKISRSILNFASDLGAGRLLGAAVGGLSAIASPAAAAAATAATVGATANGPLALGGIFTGQSGAALGGAALGGAAASPGRTVRQLEKSLPVVTAKAKELNVVVGTGIGGAFSRVAAVAVRVGSAVKRLASPLNIVLAIITAIVVKFSTGFLDGLKIATGETNKWAAATKLVGLAWRTSLRSIQTFLSTSGSFLNKWVINPIAMEVNNFLTSIAKGIAMFFAILKQALADLMRTLADIQDTLNGWLGMDLDTQPARNLANLLAPATNRSYLDIGKDAGDEFMKGVGQVGGKDGKNGFAGGVFGQVSKAFEMLGDIGKEWGQAMDNAFKDQKAIDSYKQRLIEVGTEMDRIKDLIESPDGAVGGFLAPEAQEQIKAQIAEMQKLKEVYSSSGFDSRSLNDVGERQAIESAEGALVTMQEFFRNTADSLTKFDAVVRQAGGDEDVLRQAIESLGTDFEKAAQKLPPAARDAAIAGASEMVAQADAILTAGAATIRENVLQAFGGGFGAVVSQMLANAQYNSNPNLPPTQGPEDIKAAIGDGGKKPIEDATAAIQKYGTEVRGITNDVTRFQEAGAGAFKQAGSNAKNAASDIQQFFEGAFSSLEDALVGFVTTGKLDFKSLINSIIADLARMVIRMLIIKPLMGFFGGLFGFSGGGIVPGFANGGIIPGYAPGGIISGFGGARQDNQLIAASPGEMMINAASTKANKEELQYINKTGKMPPGGGGNGTTVFAPNITINESGNDPQLTAQMVDAAVRRSWDELAVKSQRKGGIFDRNRGQ
jgi:tape measure domain-containing protein